MCRARNRTHTAISVLSVCPLITFRPLPRWPIMLGVLGYTGHSSGTGSLCSFSKRFYYFFYYYLPATVDNTLSCPPERLLAFFFLNHSSVFKIGNSYGLNTTNYKRYIVKSLSTLVPHLPSKNLHFTPK